MGIIFIDSLRNRRIRADLTEQLVLARTEGLDNRHRRATSFIGSSFAGEPWVRACRGRGKALVCWTPYCNQFIMDEMES